MTADQYYALLSRVRRVDVIRGGDQAARNQLAADDLAAEADMEDRAKLKAS